MQSLSLSPYLTPSLSLCLSHHAYLCSVLTILLPSPSSVFPNSLCSPPHPCLYVPSLSHRTSLTPLSHSSHLLLVFIERSGRKRMTEADLYLCDHPNFVIMFGQSPSLSCLMELHCLPGICSHATGREPFLLNRTYITSHLHEMWRFH